MQSKPINDKFEEEIGDLKDGIKYLKYIEGLPAVPAIKYPARIEETGTAAIDGSKKKKLRIISESLY